MSGRRAEATPRGSQVEAVQASRLRSGGTTREEGLNGRLTSSEMVRQIMPQHLDTVTKKEMDQEKIWLHDKRTKAN